LLLKVVVVGVNMLKRIIFILTTLLFLKSTAYPESVTLKKEGTFYDQYFIRTIAAKNNYLFVLGTTPPMPELYNFETGNFRVEPYAFFDIIDLRYSNTVFSSGYLFKEFDISAKRFVKDKYLTISDKYAFVGFFGTLGVSNSEEVTTKVYDISNLPEVTEKGSINIFPSAVSGNKAFVINKEGVFVYNIKDISNPILKSQYLKPGIFKIEVEDNKVYIGYYSNRKEATYLEILKIKNFSLKKTGKSFLLLRGKRADYFNYFDKVYEDGAFPGSYDFVPAFPPPAFPYAFHVKNNYVYILNRKNIKVLDVSDPEDVKKINIKTISGSGYWTNIISGNYAILVGDAPAIILDISDPYNISVAGSASNIYDYYGGPVLEELTGANGYVVRVSTFYTGYRERPTGDYVGVFKIIPLENE